MYTKGGVIISNIIPIIAKVRVASLPSGNRGGELEGRLFPSGVPESNTLCAIAKANNITDKHIHSNVDKSGFMLDKILCTHSMLRASTGTATICPAESINHDLLPVESIINSSYNVILSGKDTKKYNIFFRIPLNKDIFYVHR